MKRVEAARRLFPSIWFNEKTTEPGLDALGWYHEKRDDARNIGLGPEHDWSSHGADAFGLMCVAYEQPETRRSSSTSGAGGSMADDADLMRLMRERYDAAIDADRDNRDRDEKDRLFYTGGDASMAARAFPRSASTRAARASRSTAFRSSSSKSRARSGRTSRRSRCFPSMGRPIPRLPTSIRRSSAISRERVEAHRVYANETEKAVIGGCGWWRVKSAYCDDADFDQDLGIEGIANPNSVACRSRRSPPDPFGHEVVRSFPSSSVASGSRRTIPTHRLTTSRRRGSAGLGAGRVRPHRRVLGEERGRQADGVCRRSAAGQRREPQRR
jgi:hypothetical protein